MRLFLIISFFIVCHWTTAQSTLISFGSDWHYYDAGNEPASQGAADWNDNAFDHLSWANGNAQLGYGDNDEATEIGDTTLTGYFRTSFEVSDPNLFDQLSLDLLYDDGAVVYLNGGEVWRVNMPDGPVNYNTFAAANSGDDALASLDIDSTLLAGTNILAVEVHQRSAGSSDLSFDFQLVANPIGVVNVVRGPYIQMLSPNSATVKWRTNIATTSVLAFGGVEGQLNSTLTDTIQKTEHSVRVDSLAPNTTYYYQIENDQTVLIPADSSMHFRTAPMTGSTAPLTFWVLGDCGTANNNQRAVRDAFYTYAAENHTDGILFLGDNAYTDGTDNEYQFSLFENMYEDKLKNTVSWSCLGNHDGHSANSNQQSGPYYDIFTFPKLGEAGGLPSGTEAYYSFDYGNVHFISLDSYETDRSVGGTMYNWCENDIQNTTAEWIVAFWHHPAYTKGSHDSDTESALKQMRENFAPMLEFNGIDLILSGHSHSYERSFFLNGHYDLSATFDSTTHTVGATGNGNGQLSGDGVYAKSSFGADAGKGAVYITAGASGKTGAGDLNHNAMFHSIAALGSCILEIDSNELTVKYLRSNNMIEDFFTIVKDPFCQNDTVFHALASGTGSLSELINCHPAGSTIYLDASSISDTIILNNTILVDKDLTIVGVNGPDAVVQIIGSAPLFEISNGVSLHLKDFVLIGSDLTNAGKAIVNHGTLTLEDMIVHDPNSAIGSLVLNHGVMNFIGLNNLDR